jgi:hypothetical protein
MFSFSFVSSDYFYITEEIRHVLVKPVFWHLIFARSDMGYVRSYFLIPQYPLAMH